MSGLLMWTREAGLSSTAHLHATFRLRRTEGCGFIARLACCYSTRVGIGSYFGQHAGLWLAVFPTSFRTTARSCHYRIALRIRLGAWLPGLASGYVSCGGCGLESP